MRIFLRLFAAFATCLAISSQAQILYGATGGAAASNLYSINKANGAATVIAPMTVALTGMSYNAADGKMYGATSVLSPVCGSCLVTVNLHTGAVTVIGAFGLSISELEFAGDGTLYGWAEGPDDLARINLTTGVATVVGPSGTGTAGDGMAFVNGTLYAMLTGSTGNVWSVNTTTGAAVLGPALTGAPSSNSVSAATIDPGSGLFYASIQGAPGFIITINVTTGVITTIGATVNGIDALAFAPTPVVPTLSEWSLALLALVLLAVGAIAVRRRSRRTATPA